MMSLSSVPAEDKMSDKALLRVRNLRKYFPVSSSFLSPPVQQVHAVDDISFDIMTGETLGLVGESGCGKSTTSRLIMRLIEPTSGEVWLDERNVSSSKKASLQEIRRDMQMVFQDPYASLDPRMNVASLIGEALTVHKLVSGRKQRDERVVDLLQTVGLSREHLYRYPHEFSGGQRQRIGIARALAVEPKLVICDEPVSALDVSVQAQVVNLLEDLQQKFGLTYLFVAHDLSIVKHISNRVAVMYLGQIVEIGATDDVYDNPVHPYTEALLSAAPIPDPTKKARRIVLQGDVPSPVNPSPGCRFFTRCPIRVDACASTEQSLQEVSPGHRVACMVRAPASASLNSSPKI